MQIDERKLFKHSHVYHLFRRVVCAVMVLVVILSLRKIDRELLQTNIITLSGREQIEYVNRERESEREKARKTSFSIPGSNGCSFSHTHASNYFL